MEQKKKDTITKWKEIANQSKILREKWLEALSTQYAEEGK